MHSHPAPVVSPDLQAPQSLLCLCLLAALADGELAESERANLRAFAAEAGGEIETALREIFLGRHTLAAIAASFQAQEQKILAYEMARAVCESDGVVNPREQAFLDDLRQRLGLTPLAAQAADAEVDAIVLPPPVEEVLPTPAVSNDQRILRYAILCGALEILPSSLATMAILPLQMKLVYAIAKSHGVVLGKSNIKDFLAVLGVGVTSQMVEGFARQLLGRIGKSVAGKLGRALGSQAAGSAMSFASTFAIGHVADRYYSSGQKLPAAEIQSLMGDLTRRAQLLYTSKRPEIEAAACSLNPQKIGELVRGEPGA